MAKGKKGKKGKNNDDEGLGLLLRLFTNWKFGAPITAYKATHRE